jgi:purine-binding chemotaxis protein CheW
MEMSDQRQVLTFVLNDEVYGFDIIRVQEIKDLEKCTPIPNAPNYTCGVINLRGAVVPIFDLRKRFFNQDKEQGVTIVTKVMVEEKEKTIGMIVDAVSNTEFADFDLLQPAAAGQVTDAFVLGLISLASVMVIVIDIDKLMLI